MSTHTGKIGRLSKGRREELGQRIEDGQAGPELADWLNSLPDVQAVLREKFGGRPISEQNLSAWRLSGHVNWLRRQEARAGVMELIGDSNQMDDSVGDWSLGERLGTALAAELNAVGMALLSGETDLDKRWERLKEIHREVSRLRQDDDRARRAALQQERWDRELEREGIHMERVNRCVDESEVQGPESKVTDVEKAVNREESRQNKVNQGASAGQSPTSEVGKETRDERDPRDVHDGLAGACEGRGMFGRGIKNEELGMKNGDGAKGKDVRDEKDLRDVKAAENSVAEKAAEPFLWYAAPYVPDPNPEVEAYNRWWRMNRNFEKFDYDELQRIYAELPRKIAEYKARLICEASGHVECLEGAGI
jgi:hypothetical protein